MRVLILGADGYIGWALAQYLKSKGHEVYGLDNGLRRKVTKRLGTGSIIPIDNPRDRLDLLDGGDLEKADVGTLNSIFMMLVDHHPECIINLAQLPSAPYSMMGWRECVETQQNNMLTNLACLWAVRNTSPETPIITLGTMGEYGTPPVNPIPEGDCVFEYNGYKFEAQFPRQPGSLYHASKVHASTNCEFASRTWGLRITDIMQGIVYGVSAPGVHKATRFDIDEAFGTVLNRFCAQAVIEMPLTVYGSGGQTRGLLPLRDSLRCIELLMKNPPDPFEYRVVNQFDQAYSVAELAQTVQEVGVEFGLKVKIEHLENPRIELTEHMYEPAREKLVELGYEPRGQLREEVRQMLDLLIPQRARIQAVRSAMLPRTKWTRR